MRMERLENGCLKIVLSEQELAERQLDFSLLDYHNAATRRTLEELLQEAGRRTGFQAPGRLIIEALPLEGGCLLLVTPAALRSRLRIRRAPGPYVYTFPDAEALLSLAAGWGCRPLRAREITASSLYRCGEGYRLVVWPSLAFSKPARRLLERYAVGRREGEAAAAFAAEHDTPLVIGQALPALCAPYARPSA